MFTFLFVTIEILIKKILKKENFQYHNNNKKFNDDYNPHFSSPAGHIIESVVIETKKSVQKRNYRFHLFSG
jgi:hypothetical protein